MPDKRVKLVKVTRYAENGQSVFVKFINILDYWMCKKCFAYTKKGDWHGCPASDF